MASRILVCLHHQGMVRNSRDCKESRNLLLHLSRLLKTSSIVAWATLLSVMAWSWSKTMLSTSSQSKSPDPVGISESTKLQMVMPLPSKEAQVIKFPVIHLYSSPRCFKSKSSMIPRTAPRMPSIPRHSRSNTWLLFIQREIIYRGLRPRSWSCQLDSSEECPRTRRSSRFTNQTLVIHKH